MVQGARHGFAGAVIPARAMLYGPRPIAWIILAVFATLLIVFTTLTVRVDRDAVSCRFGPGPISKRIALADVDEVSVVRNKWYYGLGIRLVPGGWMWNVYGLSAVNLALTNGRNFRIGSDEPEELARQIRNAKAARG